MGCVCVFVTQGGSVSQSQMGDRTVCVQQSPLRAVLITFVRSLRCRRASAAVCGFLPVAFGCSLDVADRGTRLDVAASQTGARCLRCLQDPVRFVTVVNALLRDQCVRSTHAVQRRALFVWWRSALCALDSSATAGRCSEASVLEVVGRWCVHRAQMRASLEAWIEGALGCWNTNRMLYGKSFPSASVECCAHRKVTVFPQKC
jgi:hypothetical protein